VAAAGLALSAGEAGAQVAWETPRLLGPETPGGFGVYWIEFGTLPGDESGVLVTWRPPGFPETVSLRGGAGDGADGSSSGFGGVDLRVPFAEHRPGQPLDLAWISGAGVGVGDYTLVTLPVGVAAGRSWSSGSIWLAPYVSAGIAMDLRLGDEAPDEEFEVSPTADVGVDLALDRGKTVILRAGTSLGDRNALAVGATVQLGGS
jgi:hypothetical protein